MSDKVAYQKDYMRDYRNKNKERNIICNRKGALKYYYWNKVKKEFLAIDPKVFH